jgi:serine/threonine-protein kinase
MIGQRLGAWILERDLGRGGMGCVYLARRAEPDLRFPEVAAVKVLAAELSVDPGVRERFQREIEVLRHFDHPNIVRFLEDGPLFFAMELLPGPSLEALLTSRERLSWSEVLHLALQVCSALKYAHDRGVVHRDLKPSNLLLAPPSGKRYALDQRLPPDAVIKLTDFGIARIIIESNLTMTGRVVGTPEFLSPEQAMGKPATKRSDLYSLGVLLYTLLAGQPPFCGEVTEVLHKHRYGQYERLSRLVSDVPHDLEEVIDQLLAKEPDDRPSDAGTVQKTLDRLRRKYERQATEQTLAGTGVVASDEEPTREQEIGPATLMANLMRQELEEQNRGGPIRRFLNHPLVLVTLFVLTVGILVWTFWPASDADLYEKGAALMASDNPDDWERGWENYLEPLQRRRPDHPYQDQMKEFRRKAETVQAEREAAQRTRRLKPVSEAEWFFRQGLRLRQQGKNEEAERLWKNLIGAFGATPAEQPWVRLAEKELKEPTKRELTGDERWQPVREALQRARALREEGKTQEADAIEKSLRELYGDEPEAPVR